MKRALSRMGLRAKAAIVVLAVIMVGLSITASTTILQTNRLVAAGERNQVNAMARSLAEACKLPLAVGDKAELRRLLRSFLWSKHILFVAVYNAAGRLICNVAQDEAAWALFNETRQEGEGLFIGQKTVELSTNQGEFSPFGDDKVTATAPSQQAAVPGTSLLFQVIGRAVVGQSTAPMHLAQRSQMRMTLIMVLLAVGVSVAIVFWASKDWIRRLNALVGAGERISRGDFTQVIHDTSSDEIGRLSQTYERMREAVGDRTAKLIETNKRLRQAQADLVQSEKMGMLGQLSAGVAHEINTPTGAILNVAADAQEHLRKLVLLEMGTAELPDETRRWLLERVPEILSERPTASEASVRAKRREIEKHLRSRGCPDHRRMAGVIVSCGLAEELSDDKLLGHLSEETVLSVLEHVVALKTASEVSLASAKKIARIVRALRFYARTGPEELTEMNINESIDNTLVILQNRIKHLAEVKTRFAEDLPPVRCGPDISQVWTNLINNACDAVQESHKEEMGLIVVSTRAKNGQVLVEIHDDGPPIPEDVMQKMYDPFFTTKPIGKGTGLGLSICVGIVQRAGGTIAARNEPGGVTLTVSLPAVSTDQKGEPTGHGELEAEPVGASVQGTGD